MHIVFSGHSELIPSQARFPPLPEAPDSDLVLALFWSFPSPSGASALRVLGSFLQSVHLFPDDLHFLIL